MLRSADELRDPAEYFDEVPSVKPRKDMVELNSSRNILDVDPTKFEDYYGVALNELVQEKTQGYRVAEEAAADRRQRLNFNNVMAPPKMKHQGQGLQKKARNGLRQTPQPSKRHSHRKVPTQKPKELKKGERAWRKKASAGLAH